MGNSKCYSLFNLYFLPGCCHSIPWYQIPSRLMPLIHMSPALTPSLSSMQVCFASPTSPLGYLKLLFKAPQTSSHHRIPDLSHSQCYSSLSFFHVSVWHHHLKFCSGQKSKSHLQFFFFLLPTSGHLKVISVFKTDLLTTFATCSRHHHLLPGLLY